ncbi:MAG: response regulator [Magnetospirillum sp. WYHS-4]
MLQRPFIKLLLVEDNPGDARLVQVMLEEVGGFEIVWAATLADALARVEDGGLDAALLDLSLPDSHGLETLRRLRDKAPGLPIVIFTGFDDEELGLRAVQEGCQDYLVKGQGDGNLVRRTLHYAVERKLADEDRRRYVERLKRTLMQTVHAVSLTIEMRDPYTAGHQRRVAQLAVAIGRHLNLDRDVLDGLETGALIHDLGKINVPADFLARPGHLSEAAFRVVMAHPQVGFEIVSGIEFPWPVATMILQHHERLDGTGYPNGISGDEIILEARILAVADVVEAISSHRPYRPSLGLRAAMEEIRNHAGIRYDPRVVEACEEVIQSHEFDPNEFPSEIPALLI